MTGSGARKKPVTAASTAPSKADTPTIRRSPRGSPRSGYSVDDPAAGNDMLTRTDMSTCVTGVVKEVVKNEAFRRTLEEERVGHTSNIKKACLDNINKDAKDVVNAAKLSGVKLLADNLEKPLSAACRVSVQFPFVRHVGAETLASLPYHPCWLVFVKCQRRDNPPLPPPHRVPPSYSPERVGVTFFLLFQVLLGLFSCCVRTGVHDCSFHFYICGSYVKQLLEDYLALSGTPGQSMYVCLYVGTLIFRIANHTEFYCCCVCCLSAVLISDIQ